MEETIDLGICMGDRSLGNTPFSAVPLAQLSLAVIVRKDHPLTRLDKFRAQDMERYPLIRSPAPAYSFDDDVLPVVVGLERPAVTAGDHEVLHSSSRQS